MDSDLRSHEYVLQGRVLLEWCRPVESASRLGYAWCTLNVRIWVFDKSQADVVVL